MTIAGNDVAEEREQRKATTFNTMPAAPVQTTVPDRRPQSYVRTKVEEVLLDYGRNNPLVKKKYRLFFLPLGYSYSMPSIGWSSSSLACSILLVSGTSVQAWCLGVICGMASKTWLCFRGTTCYHVNFLASTHVHVPNNANTSTPKCKLLFAEFWNRAGGEFFFLIY
jgi:ABC-type dipeptide/oligopeptide/nickel transport system permease component